MTSHEKPQSRKEEYVVLPAHMGGGPKGLGDPENRYIRTIEKELIYKRMREESKKLCPEEDKVFEACLKEGGFFFFKRCYSSSQALKRCQIRWFNDKEFEKKITEDYLNDRSEYRRTGITKEMKDKEIRLQKEFMEWSKQREAQKKSQPDTLG